MPVFPLGARFTSAVRATRLASALLRAASRFYADRMTMLQTRPFAQVDVFGAEPYSGNPVAVVLDADGIDEEAMAAFARWTNLSETTFVLGPTDPAADYRLRIFTPGGELPFAGHPTLGSAHAWLEAGGSPAGESVVQQCAAGLVEVRRTTSGLAFTAPPTVRSGPLDDALLARVAHALEVRRDEIVDHQWVDNGPGWLAVELATAERVLALALELGGVDDLMIGVLGRHPEGHSSRWEVRGFCPRIGVAEDPVTGSLNASIAQWKHRVGDAPTRYSNTQGTRVARNGLVGVEADGDGVRIGGATTTLISGTVLL